MEDPNRRRTVFQAAKNVLNSAEKYSVTNVGFFTMGLEVGRIPSWEIAEELVRALNAHSVVASSVQQVFFIASSPTQLSSFQFALNNADLYASSI
jgi:O-acetyl-ADP-ribose deacetylase (regulator of RNase III)